ncbi:MAG: UvrD-helicase domain-containing protein [Muribaculaceae bacterium]|nr:UvrD-helicase domain-containing protein [Muribaculaceae bacterium]
MLTIYKASAGSGKTFTLAFEYIKTVLGYKLPGTETYVLNADKYMPSGHRRRNRHRTILAITFTNAATEEMKARIVRELAALSTDEGASASLYGKWLTRDYGCTAGELRTAAATALAEMLYDYGNFNVSTIDSFFQTVLRTFSREVDHQGDYELQLDTLLMMKQSVSVMLDEINYMPRAGRSRLVDWVKRYSLGKMSEGKGYNFFNREGDILNALTRAMADSLDETYGNYAAELRRYLEDPARIEAFGRELSRKALEALAPARTAARDFLAKAAAAGLPETIFNKAVYARVCDAAKGRPVDVGIKGISDIATGEKEPKSLLVATHLKKAGLKAEALADYSEALADFCRKVYVGVPLSAYYGELLESLGALDFFGMSTARLEEYLRANNTVLISDTGELLRRIISDAEMPFIYERLGMTLETLLIDEFQDTSHLQWHNLRPLVANSIAEGHDNLIIGDEKQAIYRFRNSDSELLGSIVQTRDFPHDHRLRGFEPADNTNHRSAADLVRVNNTVFGRMAGLYGADSYGNVVQTPAEGMRSVPAYVKVKFDPDGNLSTEALLEEMAQEILRQHREGGYRWRDILILTRWRAEATTVVEYLVQNHPEIAVLSSEALLLSSSPAVRTIMSMLKLVEGSYSGKRADVEGAPKYASNADIVLMITRYNYYHAAGYPPEDALRMALDSEQATESLDREIRAIRAENPANLVALIEAIVCHKLSEEQRRAENAYITALQDLAVHHTEGPDPSIKSFLEAYQLNIDRWAIKASAELDAVEVMTVHKSKGLERDCVHIPFADWELTHGTQSAWLPLDGLEGFDPAIVPPVLRVTVTSKSALRNKLVSPFAGIFERDEKLETIDNLNTAYVAFTRAARELCVHSTVKKIGRGLHEVFCALPDSAELADDARIDLACGFDALDETFTLGEPTVKAAGKSKGEEKATVYADGYPVLFNDKTRRLTSIDDILSTSLDIGGEEEKEIVDEPVAPPLLVEAAERGNILHSILASARTLADIPASAAAVGRRAGLDADTVADYCRELQDAIADGGPCVQSWFDPAMKVYAERAIYVADSDATFRPDRVVVAPDGATMVVDYKFTTEARPGHFRQVENYIRLLTELGHSDVQGYLWYPLLGILKKVTPR